MTSISELYRSPGAVFSKESGALDVVFAASIISAPIASLPRLLATRLAYEIDDLPGTTHAFRLRIGSPARATIVLEYFTEGAMVAREQGLSALQCCTLLSLLDKVLVLASGSSSYDSACTFWDNALDRVSANRDALGVVAAAGQEEEGNVSAIPAILRGKLDAWMKSTGPLHSRHWAMMVSALALQDGRQRKPVAIRVPIEVPLVMGPLPEMEVATSAQGAH